MIERSGMARGWKVLDFGCGLLSYQELVAATGADYEGAEIQGNSRAQHVIDLDGRLSVDTGSFDAVLSSQVLEHVPTPASYVAEANRVLKPGGKLLLSTHGMWVFHPAPNDFWRWTAPGLQLELECAGFQILDIQGRIGLLATGLHSVQDNFFRRTSRYLRWLRKPFVTVMQTLIVFAARHTSPHSMLKDAIIFAVVAESLESPAVVGAGR